MTVLVVEAVDGDDDVGEDVCVVAEEDVRVPERDTVGEPEVGEGDAPLDSDLHTRKVSSVYLTKEAKTDLVDDVDVLALIEAVDLGGSEQAEAVWAARLPL